MKISTLEITNIKGIGHKSFQLDLVPNKPNILVAPNGFGKSSIAIGFDSLRSNKIELSEKNYHKKDDTNRPVLSLTLSNNTTLTADDNQNTIKDQFDVVVINNQTEPKSAGRPPFTKTTLDILPTVLVQTIPPKVDFTYSSSTIKTAFGTNGSKRNLLKNVSNLFNSSKLLAKIQEVDFTRFNLKGYKEVIEPAIAQINEQIGSGDLIKTFIASDILDPFRGLVVLKKLADTINSFGFEEIENEVDAYLTAWQFIQVKNSMGANFLKACKFQFYLEEKEHYTQTIDSFNPVRDRFDIKPKKDKNSLVIKWPKAHEISNGQRDILTFIALLLKSRRDFKKRDCILVIDEIFDYMDDGNLITFQYFISTFIDEMKRDKRRIFPILLTHLDPLFFNHFCFNDTKIHVNYIKDIKVKTNQNILNLIYKREDESIKDIVDAHYFHYHPSSDTIDVTEEFRALGLIKDWGVPQMFFKKIFREVRRYLLENEDFDTLAICFGVRVQIEKLVYDKIPDDENKRKFIEETNGTKNKLLFAQGLGVQIPETYFLLGIIYNTSLHLSQGQDISKPLGLKLENGTIKQMINNLFIT